MKTMNTIAVKTPLFHAGDSLVEFIVRHTPAELIAENIVLAVTSKIVSLAEGRLVSATAANKKNLVVEESDYFLGEIGYGVNLSIKHALLLPSAGIDESNSENEDFILHPANPHASAHRLWQALRKTWNLKNLGIILTDSRSGPLRLGVTGAALSCAGFFPVRDRIGDKDLFGRPLKVTKVNIADSLATSAVLMMGEADESCPLAILNNAPVEFCETFDLDSWQVTPENDMYLPLYKHLIKPKT